jgi:protein-L-isoaspartate(D-aspartate) O-methyltransferase
VAAKRTSSERLRSRLVKDLRGKGVIASDAVQAAFLAVPRERFIPEAATEHGLEAIYRDQAIVTKRDPRGIPLSSSSQPALMAKMLELLAPRPGDRVLEIGTGTGYNAALLAEMVGSRGRVTSVDVDAGLARRARPALREAGYRVSVKVADGRAGHPSGAPYDRIIVTACADEIPNAWREQLADGARIELPLRLDPDGAAIQVIPVLQREGDRLRSTALTWGGFMPLHSGDGGWRPLPATLAANRSVKGRHTSLVSLSGAGLDQLPTHAARELRLRRRRRRGPARPANLRVASAPARTSNQASDNRARAQGRAASQLRLDERLARQPHHPGVGLRVAVLRSSGRRL